MTGELIDIFPAQMWATGNDTAGSWTAERPTGRWALVGSTPMLAVQYTRADLVEAQRTADYRAGMLAGLEAAAKVAKAHDYSVRASSGADLRAVQIENEIRAIAADPAKLAALMKDQSNG